MWRVVFGMLLFTTVLRVGYTLRYGVRDPSPTAQDDRRTTALSSFNRFSASFRKEAADRLERYLPSPHSDLVAGMVLGENRINDVSRYNDVLKAVGLVHVVVVSGYNISLVFALVAKVFGSPYRAKNLLFGLLITLLYAGISGFGLPAIRAWVMGSVAAIYKYYGRPHRGVLALIYCALVILVIDPYQAASVSFQLSFLATLGVMLVPFSATLGAQLLVNPLISYYFGTVSVSALIVNPLVLWVVPVCTVLGGLLVFSVFVSRFLSYILSIIMFPFLDLFVSFSLFFSRFSFASVPLRFNVWGIIIYYMVLFTLYILYKSRLVAGDAK